MDGNQYAGFLRTRPEALRPQDVGLSRGMQVTPARVVTSLGETLLQTPPPSRCSATRPPKPAPTAAWSTAGSPGPTPPVPRYTAALDACALVPIALADTLLRVAEKGLYWPLWSDRILGEAQGAIEEIHLVRIADNHR
jgi:hypothetical protein